MNANAEIIQVDTGLAVYSEFRAQLAALADDNKKAVFDYEDSEGNKDARSHVHKLRQTKGAVEKARKAEKQESLDYGRKVDGEAKDIIGQIEAMIDIHAAPLKEIEDREKLRIEALEKRLEELSDPTNLSPVLSADEYQAQIDKTDAIAIDKSWDEFEEGAQRTKNTTLNWLRGCLEDAQKREAEAAELEQLRIEKAEREQRDRDERLQREAADAARIEAEGKAERERKEAAEKVEREQKQRDAEAAQREADLKAERETAKREKAEAEQRATDAQAKAKRDLEAQQKADADAAKKREANKKYRAKINNAAVNALVAEQFTEADAKTVVTLIASGKVPFVSIKY